MKMSRLSLNTAHPELGDKCLDGGELVPLHLLEGHSVLHQQAAAGCRILLRSHTVSHVRLLQVLQRTDHSV